MTQLKKSHIPLNVAANQNSNQHPEQMANIGSKFLLENNQTDLRRRDRHFRALKARLEHDKIQNIPHKDDNYTCPHTGITASVTTIAGWESIIVEVTEKTN